MMAEYFQYDDEAIDYLKRVDSRLSDVIDKIGHIDRKVTPNLFVALVNAIVGQQISTKAQVTVWNRLVDKVGEVTPDSIVQLPPDELQSVGLSFRKVDYMRKAAQKIIDGELDIQGLYHKTPDEITQELSTLDGIGQWTAEMLMLFSMQLPDILSYGDLAIIRGLRMVYHHRKIDKKLFNKYKRRYSPYGSVASLYLWAVAGGAIPEMKDYAPKKK